MPSHPSSRTSTIPQRTLPFPTSSKLFLSRTTKTPIEVTMRSVFALVTLLAATVAARFDGPCTDLACGEASVNCEADGMVCVPFPSVDVEKRLGCTCSVG